MVQRKMLSRAVASSASGVGSLTRGLSILALGAVVLLPLGCGASSHSTQSGLGTISRAQGIISPAAPGGIPGPKPGGGGGSDKTDLYAGDIKTQYDIAWGIVSKSEYDAVDGIDGMRMKLSGVLTQLKAGKVQPAYRQTKAAGDQALELNLGTSAQAVADLAALRAALSALEADLLALLPGGEETE